ncbi:MAG TPA: hypothetical protein PLR90_07975 [Methylophilus sp.]|nr:hypothetical protein [Methylophilus sp.]HQQ33840.1 hypothetical protein [Methylophilus sp.]
MEAKKLNIQTAKYAENSKDGIMICGINWGGSPDDAPSNETKSFFSDQSVNNYRYRNRIVTWFQLFRHPLEVTESKATAFERSIIQTNWLSTQSRNMQNNHVFDECVNEWGNFEFHVRELQPKLIIFLSVTLLDVLNSKSCIDRTRRLFGNEIDLKKILKKDVYEEARRLRSFRIGIQRFENTDVIALPHPTGSKGLSDNYIRAFDQDISPLIDKYKVVRGFK